MKKIVDECVCPSCGKHIVRIQDRKPGLRDLSKDYGNSGMVKFARIKGKYHWEVEEEDIKS
jgi:hypothetical protein